jgi:purine-binding chemotaxis protein CheW
VSSNALLEGGQGVRAAREDVRLLDETRTESILRSRARRLARPAPAAESGAVIDVLAFRLGAELYAVAPEHVGLVCRVEHVAPLPGVPAFVLGIARVRGEIVSVLDVSRLLGLPQRSLGQVNSLLVLQSRQMRFGVLADEVAGMRRVDRAELIASLPTLEGGKDRYVMGITAEPMVVLDGARLLADDRLLVDYGAERGGRRTS